jgi:hypothetical protein
MQAEDFDDAGIWLGESFTDFNGGGFPGAIGTKQTETFAWMHFEIKAVNGDHVFVGLLEVAHPEGCGGHPSSMD